MICKPVIDKIINSLGIGANLKEVADRMQSVMGDVDSIKDKLIYITRFDRDYFYNIGIQNNLYHMSKAMLESLTYEV